MQVMEPRGIEIFFQAILRMRESGVIDSRAKGHAAQKYTFLARSRILPPPM